MRVVLAGVPGVLFSALRPELARHHDIRILHADARDRDACLAAADCDVVIHGLASHDDAADAIEAATRGTWNLLTTTQATRYVQLSSLRHFSSYEPGWDVHEGWSARPTTDADQLVPYLAEITSQEVARTRPVKCIVLRLAEVVTGEVFRAGPVAPDWLHIEDAVAAILRAVECDLPDGSAPWTALHIARGGPASQHELHRALAAPFSYVPRHTGPAGPVPSWSQPALPTQHVALHGLSRPHRITLFGAGGPLGSATAAVLGDQYQLRLSDLRPLAHFTAAPPQSPGAPRPQPVLPPHEECLTDITDAAAVKDAAKDTDCLINCAVIRHDPALAFRVNVVGAYNVMRAAVDAGIPRVVHTGPVLIPAAHKTGYTEDRQVTAAALARPLDDLYPISKFAAQEVCRIFAEQHRIACPALLFWGFVDPSLPPEIDRSDLLPSFLISWRDAAHAVSAAACAESLPEPCPVLHVLADTPHGRYLGDTAREVLRWQPEDRLDHLFYRTEKDLA